MNEKQEICEKCGNQDLNKSHKNLDNDNVIVLIRCNQCNHEKVITEHIG
jgi:uncharacterized cysteine cluster protein YcgN (CxxCxxCC family)